MYQKKFNKKEVVKSLETVEEVLKYPIRAVEDRGIKKETAEKFGIRCLFSESSGKVEAYYFPYTRNGKLVGFKKRDLRYPKKNDLHFSMVGDVDIQCDLFGMSSATNTKSVYVCEGEWDSAYAWQILMEQQKTPYQYPANVVSIGFGTKNASEHVANNLQFLEKYKEARIVFDNDFASEKEASKGIVKGKEATGEVCLLLGSLAKVVTLDKKDSCEYQTVQEQKELYNLLCFSVKDYEPDVLVKGGIGLDQLLVPLEKGIMIDSLPGVSRLMHGFRPGEMTTILAPTNTGKTLICREIQYSLIKSGAFVVNYFIEEDLKKTQQAMIAMDNNVLLPKFRENPSIIDYEASQQSYNDVIDNGRTLWVDTKKTFGKLSPKEFVKSLKWADAMGAKFAILDHVSMIFSASESDNERKEIDSLLTELAAFVTGTGMHLIVVSHIKRVPKVPPRDREGNIKFPYWQAVDKDAGRGSGAFEQLTHNMFVIEPEILESGARGRIRAKVVKAREWGTLGVGDVLTMHPISGRVVDAATKGDEY